MVCICLSLTGCASVGEWAQSTPLTDRQLGDVLSGIREQELRVTSFFSQGTLRVREWTWEAETQVLVVGTREPFRVKMEVTHGWGQPVLHVLVDRTRLEVLSFQENSLYVGTFTPQALSRFFPGDLDSDLIWTALRGFPGIPPRTSPLSPGRNRIAFVNEKGKEQEVLELHPESLDPARVSYPEKHLVLEFSELRETEGVRFAGLVTVDSRKAGRKLGIRRERMVFNRAIPPEIFTLEKPPNFRVLSLD